MIDDGVEVYIAKLDSSVPYTEFAHNSIGAHDRYIKSVPGERFCIIVRIYANFKWYNAIGLDIRWWRDDCPDAWLQWCPKTGGRIGAQGKELIRISEVFYREHDQWMSGELSFAEFVVDDSTMTIEEVKEAAEKKGQIRVKVDRVLKRENVGPSIHSHGAPSTKAPIKLVKEKAVSQFLKPANSKPYSGTVTSYRNTYLENRKGTAIEARFIYRSKYALRKLGVVPPSPIIRATDTVDLTEVQDSGGEDNLGTTPEHVDLEALVGNERVKREREEDEEDLDEARRRAEEHLSQLEDRIKKRNKRNGQPEASADPPGKAKRER